MFKSFKSDSKIDKKLCENCGNDFKSTKKYIRSGEWYKTKHRGWIRPELFNAYLSSGFDPVLLSWEKYKNFFRSK
jgi:hypothetical protein